MRLFNSPAFADHGILDFVAGLQYLDLFALNYQQPLSGFPDIGNGFVASQQADYLTHGTGEEEYQRRQKTADL